ncbi:MAG: autotransporter domain-containing protein [Rhodobacteraceae bacterium]|nr:autotransporter domain-containing protein [Paracoccaceae bacterium]
MPACKANSSLGLLAATLCLFDWGALEARSQSWTGSGDASSWNDASNWSSAVPPDGTDVNARIEGAASIFLTTPVTIGNLVLSGRGLVELSNSSGGSGSLIFGVSSGDAQLRATGITGTFTHVVSAPIVLNSDLEITTTPNIGLEISGNISGSGGLIKTGTSKAELSGSNTYTGGTTIDQGTLVVTTDSLPGNVENNASLQFREDTVGTYSGIISGNGSNVVSGGGTLILTAANTITGTTAISQATLQVEGSLAGGVVVGRTGTLSGSGTVGALSVAGKVAPGSSIGTLNVSGNASFFSGSTLVSEVDPLSTPNSDLLAVGGAVTGVNNLTIQVTPITIGLSASEYVAANDYVVLTGSSIDGDAPGIVESGDLPALVDVAIVGQPSVSGQVALRFSELPVAQLALQPAVISTGNTNHANLASAVATTAATGGGGQLLANSTTVATAVSTLTNNQLAQFNNVHGEPYSSYLTVGLEQVDLIMGAALDHASGLGLPGTERSTIPPRPQQDAALRHRVWMDTNYVSGSVNGESGVGSFNYDLWNIIIGADVFENSAFTGGVFAGGGGSNMDEHDTVDQSLETLSAFAGVYGRYHFTEDAALSGVAGYSYGDNSSARNNPTIGSFTGGKAETNFDSHAFFAGAKAFQKINLHDFVVTPSAGLSYSIIHQNSTSETGGGDFNYNIAGASAESLVSSLGLDFSRRFVSGASVWAPIAFARYEYDWLADANGHHEVMVSSPLFGDFEQVGQNRGAHGIIAGAGLSYDYGETVGIDFGYAYSNRTNGEEHGFGANLTIKF